MHCRSHREAAEAHVKLSTSNYYVRAQIQYTPVLAVRPARSPAFHRAMDKGRELNAQERARQASLDEIRLQHGHDTGPATLSKALGTVTLSDLAHVTEVPCARNSLLYGVGASIAIGGVRYLLTKRAAKSLNWGAASFAGVSLLAFESCRLQRYQERSMNRYAVDRVEIKRREKKDGAGGGVGDGGE